MTYSVVIPARYQSTRLPGKPLLDIAGKSMIQRVYENAKRSNARDVIVATDDQRIVDAVLKFGGEVMLTDSKHQSGTDRIQEVAKRKLYAEDHIVVNLQGDEPLLDIATIEQVANNLQKNHSAGIATLCECINEANGSHDDINNPNAVKVVRDKAEFALYFSRHAIPYARATSENTKWYRHIGLYAYRVDVLNQFVSWPCSMLETAESLEQLRALENGVKIHCAVAKLPVPSGVDTPDDLEKVRAYMQAREGNHA